MASTNCIKQQNTQKKRAALFNLRAFFLLVVSFLLALYAAWIISASFGYGYSFWYGFYDSKQHIERYAPENRFRHGFEHTTVAEHKALFQKIVESVHNDGEGLSDIHYAYGTNTIPLLHDAEIIHLQDVAHLINHIHHLGIGLLLLFAALYLNHLMAMRRYGNLINSHSQLIIVAALACLIALIFFIVGAKSIFYQMHILIFPADHQWFFYYQDSLMSTLMKAPDLFAGIAVQILFIAILLFALGLWAHHGLKRTVEAQD